MRYSIAIVAAVSVLAACGGGDSTDPTVSPGDDQTPITTDAPSTTPAGVELPGDLAGTTWVLDGNLTVGGLQPVPAGVRADLTVNADGSIDLHLGCNSGGTAIEQVDGDLVTLEPVVQTEMACDDDAMSVEAAMVATLTEPSTWYVADGSLTITPTTVTDTGLRFSAE